MLRMLIDIIMWMKLKGLAGSMTMDEYGESHGRPTSETNISMAGSCELRAFKEDSATCSTQHKNVV